MNGGIKGEVQLVRNKMCQEGLRRKRRGKSELLLNKLIHHPPSSQFSLSLSLSLSTLRTLFSLKTSSS